MGRPVLAGMISVAALLACAGNGSRAGVVPENMAEACTGSPDRVDEVPETTHAASQQVSQPVDEWSLWTGPTHLRGANTWQKRLTNGRGELWPAYTQDNLNKLATWGANYVNLSIPGPVAERPDPRGRYAWDARAWTNLEAMISCAERARLFVVVSFRTGPGRSEYVFDTTERPKTIDLWEEKVAQDAWVEMWGRTAELLRNRSAVVGYDLMVEPLLESENPDTAFVAEDWYRLAERLADTIRKVDPITPILLSVAPGGHPDSLPNLDPGRFRPNDRRVVFTVHQYAPWDYTYQPTTHSLFRCAIPRIGTAKYSAPRRRFDNSVRAELRAVYDRVQRWKRDKNVTVAVNEFGVTRWVDSADVFMAEQMQLIEALPANHAVWLWDPEECLGWDEMNFRNGPDSAYHFQVQQSALIDTIKSAWRRNTVRLP